jgi:hypothetical protein
MRLLIFHINHGVKHACWEGWLKKRALKRDKEKRILRESNVIQMDFCHYGHGINILTLCETTSGYMSATVVESKACSGEDDVKVYIVLNFIRETGLTNIILQSDRETTLEHVAQYVCKKFLTSISSNDELIKVRQIYARTTAGYQSYAQGSVERCIRILRDQVRTMVISIYNRFKQKDPEWTFSSKKKTLLQSFLPFIVRHAVYLINRKLISKTTKLHEDPKNPGEFKQAKASKTRYERLYGHPWDTSIYIFTFLQPVISKVYNKKAIDSHKNNPGYQAGATGLYLGHNDMTNGDIILDMQGKLFDVRQNIRICTEMTMEQQMEVLDLWDKNPKSKKKILIRKIIDKFQVH